MSLNDRSEIPNYSYIEKNIDSDSGDFICIKKIDLKVVITFLYINFIRKKKKKTT